MYAELPGVSVRAKLMPPPVHDSAVVIQNPLLVKLVPNAAARFEISDGKLITNPFNNKYQPIMPLDLYSDHTISQQTPMMQQYLKIKAEHRVAQLIQ